MIHLVFISALLVEVLSFSTFSELHPNLRIVGGSEVSIEDVPYQVSVTDSGEHFCGGSVIGRKHIVTAGHCVNNTVNLNPVRVVTETDGTSKGVENRVRKIFVHPNITYLDKQLDYDIAVLELEERLDFNEKCQPIALPRASEEVCDNAFMLASGFGMITGDLENENGTLRAVVVPKYRDGKCFEDYYHIRGISARMICAGSAGKGVCSADSGGPLVRNGILYGIVSWGRGCGSRFPAVYTRIASPPIRDWIKQTFNI
ncbi:trypsin 3A1-like [Phlebotomus papatasi]|uniref:trypsin 3A1-like n=1 Tax=Phlebotomus papatasi TaxID=29031 RepID=UPI0024843B3A|nr:trypsin 3A1-like [Phlebotomus papatasi]